jgi:hypothetical protein
MTTLMLAAESTAMPIVRDQLAVAETLPRYAIDPEERRWQLEWDRRNVED